MHHKFSLQVKRKQLGQHKNQPLNLHYKAGQSQKESSKKWEKYSSLDFILNITLKVPSILISVQFDKKSNANSVAKTRMRRLLLTVSQITIFSIWWGIIAAVAGNRSRSKSPWILAAKFLCVAYKFCWFFIGFFFSCCQWHCRAGGINYPTVARGNSEYASFLIFWCASFILKRWIRKRQKNKLIRTVLPSR